LKEKNMQEQGLYEFTNRRRAKDAITTLTDKYGYNGLTVYVHDGLIYVDVTGIHDDITTIMHFAVDGGNIGDSLNMDEITELYKGIGIRKFRM
jgi:uncharacterized membrane protein